MVGNAEEGEGMRCSQTWTRSKGTQSVNQLAKGRKKSIKPRVSPDKDAKKNSVFIRLSALSSTQAWNSPLNPFKTALQL